jgi:hypothetical protein
MRVAAGRSGVMRICSMHANVRIATVLDDIFSRSLRTTDYRVSNAGRAPTSEWCQNSDLIQYQVEGSTTWPLGIHNVRNTASFSVKHPVSPYIFFYYPYP